MSFRGLVFLLSGARPRGQQTFLPGGCAPAPGGWPANREPGPLGRTGRRRAQRVPCPVLARVGAEPSSCLTLLPSSLLALRSRFPGRRRLKDKGFCLF